MSGVYIKDTEMPKSCPCELIGIGYDMYCSFVHGIPARVKEYDECCKKKTRPDWCPLIPVPPHGRLGDLDELKVKIKKEDNAYGFDSYGDGMYDAFQSVYQCIDTAPTIIPASEEEMK